MKAETYRDWCENQQEQILDRVVFEAESDDLPLRLLECGSCRLRMGAAVTKTTTSFQAVEFVESGAAELSCGGSVHRLREGDLYFIENNTEYTLAAEQPLIRRYFTCCGSLLRSLLLSYGLNKGLLIVHESKGDAFRRLLELGRAEQGNAAFFRQVCQLLHDLVLDAYLRDYTGNQNASAVKIRDIIHENVFNNSFRLENIAEQLHISVPYVIGVFRKAYGVTPYKYLIRRRIKEAADLLTNGTEPISEIAASLNFSDQHYFSNVFRKEMNVSPSVYRRLYSNVKPAGKYDRMPKFDKKRVKIRDYIRENWGRCIARQTQDGGGILGLPYPFSVPSTGMNLREMYYWDTYFTNKGLILDGLLVQAEYNVMNIFSLVDRFGFMPNGNARRYLYCSQPPFLSLMVSDIYEITHDREWLQTAYDVLKREYNWWQTRRATPVRGLNRYAMEVDESDGSYRHLAAMFDRQTHSTRQDLAMAEKVAVMGAQAESGWNTTTRNNFEDSQYAMVDLNSLLFRLEDNMHYFAIQLKNGEDEMWQTRKYERQQRIVRYFWNGAIFSDYNYVLGRHSDVLSCAGYYPLFTRAANNEQARKMRDALPRIEREFGVVACEPNGDGSQCQWAYPNGWAPLHYIVVMGLDRYGFTEDARRIAEKYVATVERNYERTGRLYEKYNVCTGDTNTTNEYGPSEVMGWSAGTYLALRQYLNDVANKKNAKNEKDEKNETHETNKTKRTGTAPDAR